MYKKRNVKKKKNRERRVLWKYLQHSLEHPSAPHGRTDGRTEDRAPRTEDRGPRTEDRRADGLTRLCYLRKSTVTPVTRRSVLDGGVYLFVQVPVPFLKLLL